MVLSYILNSVADYFINENIRKGILKRENHSYKTEWDLNFLTRELLLDIFIKNENGSSEQVTTGRFSISLSNDN